MTNNLKVVGLTGGIASGKSLVAQTFRERGLPVIDADGLGHLVLEPDGAAYSKVVEKFGTEILSEDGRAIDRQKLGGLVFDSAEKRKELEAITHPAISQLAVHGLKIIEERGHSLAIYEAALIVETGLHESLDALIVVSCSTPTQMQRVCQRDGLSKEAAAVRIASQLPLSEKLAVADFTIENEGTMDELRQMAADLVDTLNDRFGQA